MVSDGDSITGILKVAHGLHQRPSRPGYRDPDRHQVFAYEGEVAGIDITTFLVDINQFSATPAVNVPDTIARVLQLLEEEPDQDMLGPFGTGEAGTRTITTS